MDGGEHGVVYPGWVGWYTGRYAQGVYREVCPGCTIPTMPECTIPTMPRVYNTHHAQGVPFMSPGCTVHEPRVYLRHAAQGVPPSCCTRCTSGCQRCTSGCQRCTSGFHRGFPWVWDIFYSLGCLTLSDGLYPFSPFVQESHCS